MYEYPRTSDLTGVLNTGAVTKLPAIYDVFVN